LPHVALLRTIVVYNYGIAHRCCNTDNSSSSHTSSNNNLGSFTLQIFQYAEKLLQSSAADVNSSSNNLLLFRLVLTRNLMMLSCQLGMSLCEHYKETLDPIVDEIVGPLALPELDTDPRASAA
jgi:hypothetical protein